VQSLRSWFCNFLRRKQEVVDLHADYSDSLI